MEFTQLQSTNLQSAGYDPETQVLQVNFVKGYGYRYLNVPEMVFQNLISAESAGRFFNANIQHVFAYERC